MSNLWIIKDALDQVQGPFETSEVLIQIKNGVFTGDEKIASYPEGTWRDISAEPEFFDYMLAVLSETELEIDEKTQNETVPDVNNNTIQIDQKTEVKIEDYLSEAEPIFPENRDEPEEEVHEGFHEENTTNPLALPVEAPIQHREVKGRSHLFEDRQAHTIDKLSELKIKSEKTKRNKKLLYLLIVFGVGLITSLLFVEDKTVVRKKSYRFVLPEKSRLEIKNQKMKTEAVTRASKLIQSDLVLNVIEGQRLLNGVLSYEARNKKSLLLLCGSYLRLWDYTSKTGTDLYVVSEIAKRAYGIGSGGDVLHVCRLTEMILRGKTVEANIAVDSYLNSEGFSGKTSFYLRYFKGFLLSIKEDYNFASSFLESSVKIQPRWVPALILLGQTYKEQNRSQEAYDVFRRILKLSPSHPEALFELTTLNIEVFSKLKIGMKYFNKAVKIARKHKTNKAIQSKAYSAVAKMYLKKGNTSKAKELAKISFDLDPSNILSKNILISTGAKADASSADKYIIAEANALYNVEEWKAATAIYEQAYKINPKNGFTALRIANCYWNQSFVKDAIKWAELAVAADPKRVEAYITLADFLISQYRLIDAARVLMKTKAINKSSYEVYRGFAQIELHRKNYKAALQFSREALKRYSNDVDSIIISIKALKKLGEIEKAYARARAAIEVSRSSFELENLYAELIMKTQGLSIAEKYINERINASSGDLKYQIILANIYIEDQQYRKAAKVAVRANEILEWESIDGVVVYANAAGALGKLEIALDNYEKAYLMKPTKADPLFESGVMLTKNLKPKGAIKQFERVERANPLFPELSYQWAVATKLLAEKEKSAELAQRAIELCRQELSRNPSHFESYLLIAESYHILGSMAKNRAEKMGTKKIEYSETYSEMISWYKLCSKNYQKAIDKAVQPGGVYIDLARCYRLSGALDQARASALVAESLDKTNPRIWFETAQIYEQQGGYREALKAYENFLLIYPNAPNKKGVEKKINKLKSIVEEK